MTETKAKAATLPFANLSEWVSGKYVFNVASSEVKNIPVSGIEIYPTLVKTGEFQLESTESPIHSYML